MARNKLRRMLNREIRDFLISAIRDVNTSPVMVGIKRTSIAYSTTVRYMNMMTVVANSPI